MSLFEKLQMAAIHHGDGHHHLIDHLAPLCKIMKMPLIVYEEKAFDLTKKYYPQIEVQLKDRFELSFHHLEKYDLIFQCFVWNQSLFSLMREKKKNSKTRIVFCPHGYSDKIGQLQGYLLYDMVLLYGNRTIQVLKKLNLFDKLPSSTVVGNFRKDFYIQHKLFYDSLVEKEFLSKLNPNNLTIFYAPTWDDNEFSSSFFNHFQNLINTVPNHFNLIVKAHPLLEIREPGAFYSIFHDLNKKNVCLFRECPLIFPLLEKADIFLGDVSSVGYDFLFFQKPMFFFETENRIKQNIYLHDYGKIIPKENLDNPFFFIEKHFFSWSKILKEKQMMGYLNTFDTSKNSSQIFDEIMCSYQQLVY